MSTDKMSTPSDGARREAFRYNMVGDRFGDYAAIRDDNGEWVSADDYAQLYAEVQLLRPRANCAYTQAEFDEVCAIGAKYMDRAADYDALRAEVDRLQALINSPELDDFDKGVVLESAHQIERWGADHDKGKTPADWFWLVGYLAGKALHAAMTGNTEKVLHHTISTASALRNWHGATKGLNNMRPGIDGAAALNEGDGQ